jgi:translocation and assembly module TamA
MNMTSTAEFLRTANSSAVTIQRSGFITLVMLSLLLLMLSTLESQAEEIERKPRVQVDIEGLDDSLLEAVEASIKIYTQRNHPRLTDGRIEALHRRAKEEIAAVLQAFGYYNPTITTELNRKDEGWLARYQIDPGEQIRVDKVEITIQGEGQQDPLLRHAVDEFPLTSGKPLVHGKYESGKRLLSRTAASQGYFEAVFLSSEMRVDVDSNQAHIAIEMDTGPRYRFGETTFSETAIGKSLLRTYPTFDRGDPYDATEVLALRNRLTQSDYFADVVVDANIETAKANGDSEVPITVTLAPRKRYLYKVGAGFGTDTGPRGVLGWENRYVNSRGHRLQANAQASLIRGATGVTYSLPFGDPVTDSWDFTAKALNENTDSRKNRTAGLTASRNTVRWGWTEALSLNFSFEDFKPGNEASRNTLLLYPGLRWSQTWADDPINTRHGERLLVNLIGASDAIVSDVSFLQFNAKAKYIHSFTERNRIIARGEFGTTMVSDFDDFPTSLRYFAGGDNSIRGFDFEELGPRNSEGKVVGGKHLVVGSVEYEYRLFGKWSVAVFSDFGNAFDDFSDDLAYSVGAGVRWQSPIGPIRLDLASALSESESKFRIHFTIGPDL